MSERINMMKSKEEIATVRALLGTLKLDFTRLSDKKPNECVNAFKGQYVNQTLQKCNEILGEKRPYPDFTAFDMDNLPTNSDVMMMLDIYYAAIGRL